MRRRRGGVILLMTVLLTAGGATARGQSDSVVSGFSAQATQSGVGAGAVTGITLGPAQKRRSPVPSAAPARVASPPAGALPAAAPPADPVLDGPMLGGAPLIDPAVLSAGEAGRGVVPTQATDPGTPATSAPSTPPAFPILEATPAHAPPAYGSPSLGYGPPVSHAPPPTFVPSAVPPAEGASAGLAPQPPLPNGMPSWREQPEAPERRFYLGGIVGADFATLSAGEGPNANRALFTAGGTLGLAFERRQGWLRTEFEARGRDPVGDRFSDPLLGGLAGVSARDGWSTMINLWRDFDLTDSLGVYLGGGIGGGGYRVVFDGGFPAFDVALSGNTAVSGFAWQAGTGATWLLSERIALDLGYRWYAVDGGPAEIVVTSPLISFSDSIDTRYGASELLLTIRVYDPFRRW